MSEKLKTLKVGNNVNVTHVRKVEKKNWCARAGGLLCGLSILLFDSNNESKKRLKKVKRESHT